MHWRLRPPARIRRSGTHGNYDALVREGTSSSEIAPSLATLDGLAIVFAGAGLALLRFERGSGVQPGSGGGNRYIRTTVQHFSTRIDPHAMVPITAEWASTSTPVTTALLTSLPPRDQFHHQIV
jgi:hypothetical protein